MAKQRRIFWGKLLRDQIYEKGLEIFMEGKSGGERKGALDMAQKEVAPDKVRNMLPSSECANFSRFVEANRARFLERRNIANLELEVRARALDEQPPNDAWPESNDDPALVDQPAEAVITEGDQIAAGMSALAQMFMKPLQDAIAAGLTQGFQPILDRLERMQAEMPRPLPVPLPVAAAPAVAPTPVRLPWQKRKICVVSNLERPHGRLLQKFPGLDIRFIHCDAKNLPDATRNVEATFVMTRFVGHDAQKRVQGKCILLPTAEGLSGLERKIAEHMKVQPGNGGAQRASQHH